MSDAVILATVAMVCVTVGCPVILAICFGRRLFGRASSNSIEFGTGPDEKRPNQ